MRRRSSARATVIGLADRLSSTVAPASAASADGGTGTHMSSHTSTCTLSPATSSAAKMRSGPNGTSWASPNGSVTVRPRWSSPGANHRFS